MNKLFISLLLLINLTFAQDWIQQVSGTTEFLTRVRFVNQVKGFAIGVNGIILKTTNGGTNWVQISSGTNKTLGGMSFGDELHGTIVGSDGTILRTTDGGDNWFFQYFDTGGLYESHVQAVHFSDENNGVISGSWGLTLKTTNGGTDWIRTILPTPSWFAGMHFIDANIGYIVGAFPHTNGEIYKTTNGGVTWIPNLTSGSSGLWGVGFINSNIGVVSGLGVMKRTTNGGTNWVDITIPGIAGINMDAIAFTSQTKGFMVGSSGKILKTIDAGLTWTSQESGQTTYLTDIYFTDANNGWIVGENGIIFKYNGETIDTNLTIPILSYPRGGQLVYSLSPTVSWYLNAINSGLTGYELQYSETLTNFNSVATKVTINSNNTFSTVLTNLHPATTYYWRMRSAAGTRTFSNYSTIDSFVTFGTQGGVIIPIPSWPRQDAFVYTLTPELSWYLPSSPTIALKYKIKYGTNSNLTGASEITNISDLKILLPRLLSNTRYYWQVCSYNGATYSEYSEIVSFRTEASLGAVIPIASWPRQGATVYSTSPTLSWYLPANASNQTYKVKYSTDPNNISGLFYVNNINGLQTNLSNLASGTTYYWQVCSSIDGGATFSNYSTPIESFVTEGQVGPEIPIASWPRDNAILYMNNTRFDWYMPTSSQGITSYTIQYSLDAGFGSSTTISGITNQYVIPSGLLPATTYYWKVKAYKGILVSDWSTVAVFRTDGSISGGSSGPTPAAAGWPRGGATVYSNSPTLNWYLTNSSIGVVSFLLKYSVNPDMSGSTNLVFPVSQTTTNLSGLTYGQTYYWTIQSYDGVTYSTFDPPESFVVYVLQVLANRSNYLAIPTPVVPMGGNIIYQNNIELSWKMNTASEVKNYDLEYSLNKDFSNSIVVPDIVTPNYKLNNLQNFSLYYWRVKAKGDNNINSENSYPGYFKTDAPTSIKDVQNIATYKLEQNYPNPFNPSTIINYQLPNNNFVTLKIYDVLGRELETLVNKEQNAGKYSVVWNAMNYYSGIYYYELKTGEFRIIKKMIFAK